MTGHPQKLNPAKTTLRRWRALGYRLLRTFAGTVIILACGLYYINDTLLNPPVKPPPPSAAGVKKTPQSPSLKKPPRAKASAAAEMANPLSLITAPKAGEDAAGPSKRTAGVPRLKTVTFAGSGGSFVPIGQAGPEEARGSRVENAPRDQEAVLLPDAALSKKVKVKGARPVPVLTGKKYSGMDPEAEFLRERVRRQAAAAEALKKELRNEKLMLAGWLALLALAVTLIPSGVIKAWRLIHKPEGSHWTLR